MPAGFDAEVAELFRDLRLASNLSEPELAQRLDTHVETVQALEQGTLYALPPWPETSRIITAYGTLLALDVRPLLRRVYAQVEAGVIPENAPDETAPPLGSLRSQGQAPMQRPMMSQAKPGAGQMPQRGPGAPLPGSRPAGPEPTASPRPLQPGPSSAAGGMNGPTMRRPNGPAMPSAFRGMPGIAPGHPQPPRKLNGAPQGRPGQSQGARPMQPPPQPAQPGPEPQRQHWRPAGAASDSGSRPAGAGEASAARRMAGNASQQAPLPQAEMSGGGRKRMIWAVVVIVSVVVASWLLFSEIRSLFGPSGTTHEQAAPPNSMQTVPDNDDPRSRKADRLPSPGPE
jgi:transcriptional regulator with XRE-family HTH domain